MVSASGSTRLIENLPGSVFADPEPLGELIDEGVLFVADFVVGERDGGGQRERALGLARILRDFLGDLLQASVATAGFEPFAVRLQHHVDRAGAQQIVREAANRATHCVAFGLG